MAKFDKMTVEELINWIMKNLTSDQIVDYLTAMASESSSSKKSKKSSSISSKKSSSSSSKKSKKLLSVIKEKSSSSKLPSGAIFLKDTVVKSMPSDGSCLFHALSSQMKTVEKVDSKDLRRIITQYIKDNSKKKFGGKTLAAWIKMEENEGSKMTVSKYVKNMQSESCWGGQLELFAFSKIYNYNVFVYKKKSNYYEQISTFPADEPKKTIRLLYVNQAHYEGLVLKK